MDNRVDRVHPGTVVNTQFGFSFKVQFCRDENTVIYVAPCGGNK